MEVARKDSRGGGGKSFSKDGGGQPQVGEKERVTKMTNYTYKQKNVSQ